MVFAARLSFVTVQLLSWPSFVFADFVNFFPCLSCLWTRCGYMKKIVIRLDECINMGASIPPLFVSLAVH